MTLWRMTLGHMNRRGFRGDQRGAAAVEFALLAPFLIVLQLGSVELVQGFEAQRRVAHVAAAMADVVSQGRTVSDAQLADAMVAGQVLVDPLPTNTLGLRIASMTADSHGVVSVDWQRSQNWTIGGQPTLPAGYLNANESVIVADVSYDYASPIHYILPVTVRFVRHAYIRPRLSNQVVKV